MPFFGIDSLLVEAGWYHNRHGVTPVKDIMCLHPLTTDDHNSSSAATATHQHLVSIYPRSKTMQFDTNFISGITVYTCLEFFVIVFQGVFIR